MNTRIYGTPIYIPSLVFLFSLSSPLPIFRIEPKTIHLLIKIVKILLIHTAFAFCKLTAQSNRTSM